MEIIETDIHKVFPYARNPRKNESAIAKVAASIKEFGFRQPIVVDSEMVIIAGHTRIEAARILGIDTVPVHIATGLTDNQIKAYRLADNRTGEDAEWDTELLALELDDLDGEIDLDILGFDQDELDTYRNTGTDGLTDEDEVPVVPDEPMTVLGDVWQLGRHRLVCGDSTDADVVAKCLNGVEPHLMVTDPPYGVMYDPKWRADCCLNNNENKMGEVLNDDISDWRDAWSLFPGDVAYVWSAPGELQFHSAEGLINSGFQIRQQIIWCKDNFVLGRGHYHYQHEPCWYAVKDNKTGHWSGDRSQSSVWNIKSRDDSGHGHGTQKPVECMRRPIENNSSPGQAVYEPFNGSGTTIIAAETTGRICHAIELSPVYVDVAINRWQNFTGLDATLESTGQKFNEISNGRTQTNTNGAKTNPG